MGPCPFGPPSCLPTGLVTWRSASVVGAAPWVFKMAKPLEEVRANLCWGFELGPCARPTGLGPWPPEFLSESDHLSRRIFELITR